MFSVYLLFWYTKCIFTHIYLDVNTKRNGWLWYWWSTTIVSNINYFAFSRAKDKKCLKMTSPPEQLVQIQNNFKEMFLMIPSTKIDQNV